MSGVGNIRVTLLWEEEIRAAAMCLVRLDNLKRMMSKESSAVEREHFNVTVKEAIEKATAALWGADDPEVALVLTRAPMPRDVTAS